MAIPPFKPPPSEYDDLSGDNNAPEEAELPLGLDDESRDGRDQDPTPDATNDRKQVARLTRKAAEELKVTRFWRMALSDEVGQRVIWGLLERAHTFETRFACSPSGFPTEYATWFQAGQQQYGEDLYHTLLRHDFEGVHRMLVRYHPDFAKPRIRRQKPKDGL